MYYVFASPSWEMLEIQIKIMGVLETLYGNIQLKYLPEMGWTYMNTRWELQAKNFTIILRIGDHDVQP